MHRPLALAVLVAGLALPSLATTPAQADTARVVLTLRPGAPLDATRPPVSASDRQQRAAASRPSAQRQRAVREWLTGHGFAVEGATAWTVTARGPAHLLERRLPAALRGAVLTVSRDRARPVEARAVPTGYGPEQLRPAYAVSGDGRGTTVATVQFSGWRAADAQVFADAAGIALRPGQITTVPVAGARGDRPDGSGGDLEVALDVQAVLGAAPAADQLVYVTTNTTAGAIAVYDAVATRAEREGLTAVSISWGACELRTAPDLMAAVELSLARIVAAGATVFAASGDVGAFGCSAPDAPDSRRSVDYPASSPSVLGVGGTSLRRAGDGWSETAWSDRTAAAGGFAGYGTGGGPSARFAAPAWQGAALGTERRTVPDLSAVADPRTGVGVFGPDAATGRRRWATVGGTSVSAPLLAGQLASTLSSLGRTLGVGRLHVPLYADPSVFRDVLRGDNLRDAAGPGYDLATGLGSPQWDRIAPLLLRPALTAPPAVRTLSVPVAAYAPTGPGTAIGLGESAEQACAGGSRVPTAAALADGPDRVVTLVLGIADAAGCRTATRTVVLDRTAPDAGAGLATTSRRGVLSLSWRGTDPAPSAGIAAVDWTLRRTDTGAVVASGTAARTGSLLRSVAPGVGYQLEVSARDRLGSRSRSVLSPTVGA